MSNEKQDHIVICGGGIIGASIAYHLVQQGARNVTVVERLGIACSASGKAGGFLAGSWSDGGPAEELSRKSFAMHAELAVNLEIKSYRRLPTLQVAQGPPSGAPRPGWLDRGGACAVMDDGTAQVTPKELTDALMDAAVARGATVTIGTVEGMQFAPHEDKRVTAVVVDGKSVSCDKVVIAMGPWSCMAEDWFNVKLPMEGIWSTSIVFKHEENSVEPYVLFCGEDDNGCHLEVYPRPDGEVYVCGLGGSSTVSGAKLRTLAPEEVVPNRARVTAAQSSFRSLSSLASEDPDITQACMRPCPPDASPIMGPIPGFKNAFIAAGHNCWGILYAPATGLCMAQLLMGEATTVDLSPFDPSRFN